MAKQALLSLFVIFVIATAAAAPPQGKDKLNVCHFGDTGEAKLLSISRSALPAHLEHGDIEAPPSVRTSADCLIPQPPPEPVAKTATTDASGVASFVIPNTNIIARFQVTDEGGSPDAGATAQLTVIGDEYLAVVAGSEQFAPAILKGKLSEARPGSPLLLLLRMVKLTYSSHLSGGAMLTPGPTLPVFTGAHFAAADYCFTNQELQSFAARYCKGIAGAAAPVFFPILIGKGGLQTATTLFYAKVPFADACDWLASQITAAKFSGRSLPIKFRVFSTVAIAGMQFFPVWFQEIDDCGGACCDQAGVCKLVSDPTHCTTRFLPLTPCNPKPCKVGACCNSASNCTVVTQAECEAIGGSYKGDDTTCSPDPCPFGACCNPKTGCTDMPAYLCSTLNGTFHGNGTTCTNVSPTKGPMVFNLTSGGGAGSASIPLPFTHGSIKTTVTVPPNVTGNQCNRNWRIEICVYRPGGRCEGAHIYAGQHFSICHTAPETVTFEQMNPPAACSHYSVNALTGGLSQVKVEVIPP